MNKGHDVAAPARPVDDRSNTWDPESTAAFWINRGSRALVRHFDARLRPFGFAMSYLPVLRALADGRSLSQTELAQAARVEQPSMAETLARMVRDGVVQREPNPRDKRGALITLTRRSRARLFKARSALVEANREAMLDLSDDEQVRLQQLLQRVVQNIESTSTTERLLNPAQPPSDAARGGVRGKHSAARKPA